MEPRSKVGMSCQEIKRNENKKNDYRFDAWKYNRKIEVMK
jgi:hypothetical protein